jgi:hypothetical protein
MKDTADDCRYVKLIAKLVDEKSGVVSADRWRFVSVSIEVVVCKMQRARRALDDLRRPHYLPALVFH